MQKCPKSFTKTNLLQNFIFKRGLWVHSDKIGNSLRFEVPKTFCFLSVLSFTTEQEVDFAIQETVKNVNRLREMSPLWEMHQEGIDLGSIEWTQH